MTKKQKKNLYRILLSSFLLLLVSLVDRFLLPDDAVFLALCLYLIPYFCVGYDVLRKAVRNIGSGRLFDENFLMSLATVGALAVGFLPNGEKEFAEAVFVMLFYQVGELFQSIAVGKSRRAIAEMMDIRPDYAWTEKDGEWVKTEPEEVTVGSRILVRSGERIPIDGIVEEGTSELDVAALTGESLPRTVRPGDSVYSGSINGSGVLRVRTTKTFGDSTVAKILELVESAGAKKSKSENFITVFARYYTPVIVFSALFVAFFPPILSGAFRDNFTEWLTRALTFLVISCPCALVISIPLSFFGGIGGASRAGILIKGGAYLESLSGIGLAVFDKTGTLTVGKFAVSEVEPEARRTEILRYIAAAERYSTHPLASAFREADPAAESVSVSEVSEVGGRGITATVDGHKVIVGTREFLKENGIYPKECKLKSTIIHLSVDGEYVGCVSLSDRVKPAAAETMAQLRTMGIRTALLSGDRYEAAEATASMLKMDDFRAELLPADKVAALEEMMKTVPTGKKTVFVGDGVNDAPVLARADIGIAMGAMGSDAAMEAADIVLMDDSLPKIVSAVRISRFTRRIVRENIAFALFVKFAVLVGGAIGVMGLWWAVFADVGVAFVAILNAMRTLSKKG